MAKRKKLSPKSRQQLQRGFAIFALLALVAAIIFVAVLDRRVTKQFEGRRWTLPARVYAQPVELYAGQNLSSARFAQELARLGYIPQTPVDRPGTFRRKGDTVDVYVRAFRFSDESQPAQKLRVGFDGDAITALSGANGADVPVFRLDPLLIGSLFPIHGDVRIVVSPVLNAAGFPTTNNTGIGGALSAAAGICERTIGTKDATASAIATSDCAAGLIAEVARDRHARGKNKTEPTPAAEHSSRKAETWFFPPLCAQLHSATKRGPDQSSETSGEQGVPRCP